MLSCMRQFRKKHDTLISGSRPAQRGFRLYHGGSFASACSFAPIMLSGNQKQCLEDANAIVIAHDDDLQLIESNDRVRPGQNVALMPKLNQ